MLAVDLCRGANVLDPHVTGFVDSILATGEGYDVGCRPTMPNGFGVQDEG